MCIVSIQLHILTKHPSWHVKQGRVYVLNYVERTGYFYMSLVTSNENQAPTITYHTFM